MTHHKDHSHADDAPIRLAKRGNLALGVLNVAVGLLTSSSAAFADGAHKVTDAYAHDDHISTAEAERYGANPEVVSRSRKRAALLIGAGALIAGGYSLYEFTSSEPESSVNWFAAASEIGSIGLTTAVAYKFSKIDKTVAGQAHSQSHNLVDLKLSVVSLGGIMADPFWAHADSAAGMLVSAASLSLGVRLYRDKIQ